MGIAGHGLLGYDGKSHRDPKNQRSGHWSLRTRGQGSQCLGGVEDMRVSEEGDQG